MQANPMECCYVGSRSLQEIATRESRVCIMNILGNESRKVSPISHVFSGGNIVAGVQYGRPGVLKTAIGNIPVYSRLADVMQKHSFDTGVIYLPPEAVYYAVTELCHYNKQLKKIIIITEKVSVKDQRLIRAICQANKIDVFGANCLGVADSWHQVRLGGALGGDRPEETLVKGTVAIYSNSGNFSTTIAEYLKTEGFGTTTIISSGKDVIIQFALAEFLYAAQQDERTKAVALYVEPGGYYEKQALDMVRSGRIEFKKPIVVCVTGRWKSNLTRACGHAGALSGSGDDALTKERWFDDFFGVGEFDPDHPERVSERGVRVVSIQHIPQAMKAVYEKIGKNPDFKASGGLGLKPWFINNFGLQLPVHLKLTTVQAAPPYDEQIKRVNRQLGMQPMRRNMRNASSVSRIDAGTQVAELHGRPIVELTDFSYEENIMFSLCGDHPSKEWLNILNMCLNYLAPPTDAEKLIVEKARANGATPNQAIAGALALSGHNTLFGEGAALMRIFLNALRENEIRDIHNPEKLDVLMKSISSGLKSLKAERSSFAKGMLEEFDAGLNKSIVIQACIKLAKKTVYAHDDLIWIAGVFVHFIYPALVLKRMTIDTAENLFAYISLITHTTFLTAVRPDQNKLLSAIAKKDNADILKKSFTKVAYQALFNDEPDAVQIEEFKALLALTLTNGPGTISAKGAKESVSARNNISTAFMGFLTNTGLSHGGSGYEAIEFLLESFKDATVNDPADISDEKAFSALAEKSANAYKKYKDAAKLSGQTKYRRIPCINHPVFKGKRINTDPREAYIHKKLKQANITNVFWEFYHKLVQALYKNGATSNVYCVNIDAVIAVISLKLMWKLWQEDKIKEQDMQDIGFLIFILGRTTGVAAEIADHRSRGQDMDCRTPVSQTRFIV